MNPEERKMLEETLALSRENHELITKLHRSVVWGRIFHGIYWFIIIGVTIGAFYFMQPFVDQAKTMYGELLETKDNLGGMLIGL